MDNPPDIIYAILDKYLHMKDASSSLKIIEQMKKIYEVQLPMFGPYSIVEYKRQECAS